MSGPPPPNPYGYNVNTTYVPHAAGVDEVVPAMPQPTTPQHQGAWAPSSQGAWGAPAAGGRSPQRGPQDMGLSFTASTAPQYVSGNMGRYGQDERIALVAPNTRSDDPSSSTAPAQPAQPAPVLQRPLEESTKYPFYNVRRYRPYFNVDTNDVLWRVGNSLIGLFRATFIETTMASPDLYGPFWVATTLVLMTAITGNFADYISWRTSGSSVPANSTAPATGGKDATSDQWFADYTKLSASAGIFYGYIFVIGMLLFFLVKWFKGELRLVNVWCVYGYALTIFIPVSMACIIPLNWLRWTLVMVATVLSGGFIMRNFKRAIFEAAPARAILILFIIFLLHLGLGLALKLYFFSY